MVHGLTVSEHANRRAVLNPADQRDVVGEVVDATPDDVHGTVQAALAASDVWKVTPVPERAAMLQRVADLFEAQEERLIGLIVREAGKTLPTPIGEVREAVDFLRYYAIQVHALLGTSDEAGLHATAHPPLGVMAGISPWNFPLAIFTGQVAAALVTGNVVGAKPAEQTSLVACEAVRLMHQAGVPTDVLQCLPGRGKTVGQPLIASSAVDAVVLTGSTETARVFADDLASLDRTFGVAAQRVDDVGITSSAQPADALAMLKEVATEAVLFEGGADRLLAVQQAVAAREDPTVPVMGLRTAQLQAGEAWPWHRLVHEKSVCINTTTAGDSASLMTRA